MKYCFESHEKTPLDPYVKEIVTFRFFDEHEIFYVPFFRKQSKDGGMFWAAASVGVQKQDKKEFVDAFQIDSYTRKKSIIAFLEERRWETQSLQAVPTPPKPEMLQVEGSVFEAPLPF